MSGRVLTHGLLFLVVTAGSHAAVTAIRTDVTIEETATIEGRAVDVIGKTVPGVFVTIIPESGGLAKRVTTDSDGAYRFEVLSGGAHRIDFEILGFDLARLNHVRVRNHAADAVLHVSAICECVTMVPPNPLAVRAGDVVDEAGRPLPHARLEVGSSIRREVAYADADGHFLLRVPVEGTWPLTAADTGFRAVTKQVSGSVAEPIVFRLPYAGTTGVADDERFSRACRCPGDLFTHSGR